MKRWELVGETELFLSIAGHSPSLAKTGLMKRRDSRAVESGEVSPKVTEEFGDSEDRAGVPCTLICLATPRNPLLQCYCHGLSLLTMRIIQLRGKH